MTTDRYQTALDELNNSFAAFHKVGSKAYDPGLSVPLLLDKAFGHPSRGFRSIHVGGTNGKGSTAHTLAAILSAAGYKTGLFTSPHLIDFRERMRIDGKMIPRERVVDFIDRWKALNLPIVPSFFEITTAMAFDWFATEKVDIVVIEVGLGGRLDSTNIITPELSVITNISLDHTALLGSTEPKIATEKAGIIKPGIPAVIGEAEGDVRAVFEEKGRKAGAPVIFASDLDAVRVTELYPDGSPVYSTPFGTFHAQLSGECQHRNAATIVASLLSLRKLGFSITDTAVAEGFGHVCELTGLAGRWMRISDSPLVIADTGHNIGGWRHIAPRLATMTGVKNMVIGFVSDKDTAPVFSLMRSIPDARLWITQASTPRATPAETLAEAARNAGLDVAGVFTSVTDAYKKALAACGESDMVFVGGSTFVVADLLEHLQARD